MRVRASTKTNVSLLSAYADGAVSRTQASKPGERRATTHMTTAEAAPLEPGCTETSKLEADSCEGDGRAGDGRVAVRLVFEARTSKPGMSGRCPETVLRASIRTMRRGT